MSLLSLNSKILEHILSLVPDTCLRLSSTVGSVLRDPAQIVAEQRVRKRWCGFDAEVHPRHMSWVYELSFPSLRCPQRFKDLQSAVDVGKLLSGRRVEIIVASGHRLKETLVVMSRDWKACSLTVRPEGGGKGEWCLDTKRGLKKPAVIVRGSCCDFTIENFRITSDEGEGLFIRQGSRVILKDVNVEGCGGCGVLVSDKNTLCEVQGGSSSSNEGNGIQAENGAAVSLHPPFSANENTGYGISAWHKGTFIDVEHGCDLKGNEKGESDEWKGGSIGRDERDSSEAPPAKRRRKFR